MGYGYETATFSYQLVEIHVTWTRQLGNDCEQGCGYNDGCDCGGCVIQMGYVSCFSALCIC
jgi:hypothetical protein